MFIKLRKSILQWFRRADDFYYDDWNGRLVERCDDKDKVTADPEKSSSRDIWNVAATSNKVYNPTANKVSVSGNESFRSDPITFKVFVGHGGTAIESSFYDTKSDSTIVSLHIVPEAEELSVAIEQIITMQSLRR